LHKKGNKVIAWNRSEKPRDQYKKFGGKTAESVVDLISELSRPRVVWTMLPSGEASEQMFFGKPQGLYYLLDRGDIVIDGSNSFFEDSIRRSRQFSKKGIVFFDSGTSGGVWGEKNGFSLMVGGPKKLWPKVQPIFRDLAAPSPLASSGRGKGEGLAYGLVGEVGSGHFVKMVHNGIEYGMMEAIAEGFGLINRVNSKTDLVQVAKIWQSGSVVRSWLIDLCRDIFEKEDFSKVVGFVKATGEGEWTVKVAHRYGVDVRVIKDALKVRNESKKPVNQRLFRNKLLALMRHRFGGHEVKKK